MEAAFLPPIAPPTRGQLGTGAHRSCHAYPAAIERRPNRPRREGLLARESWIARFPVSRQFSLAKYPKRPFRVCEPGQRSATPADHPEHLACSLRVDSASPGVPRRLDAGRNQLRLAVLRTLLSLPAIAEARRLCEPLAKCRSSEGAGAGVSQTLLWAGQLIRALKTHVTPWISQLRYTAAALLAGIFIFSSKALAMGGAVLPKAENAGPAVAAAAAAAAEPGTFGALFQRVFGIDMATFGTCSTEFVLLGVMLAACAFFSASETAITTLWPWKVREFADREGPSSPFALIEKDVTRFLTTILFANNLIIIAATALTTETAMRLWGHAGVGVATWVMTFLILFLGEITPKAAAVHKAEPVARVCAKPIHLLSLIMYPIGRMFSWGSSFVLRAAGLEASSEIKVTDQELKLILAGAEQSGAIDQEEEDMINSVLDLDQTPVREVMRSRVDIVAVDGDKTLRQFLNLELQHQYSRVPVFEGNIDNIVGIAYTKELLRCVEKPGLLESKRVKDIATPAYFVPESMPVGNLMIELRHRKTHLAIVVDEFGGTSGLVTLEDCIEEIVGEIYDETDQDLSYIAAVPEQDGAFIIQAQAPLSLVSKELGVELPEGEYETIAGFLFDVFGYIPKVGEAVETGPFRFIIEDADERHIVTVRAEYHPEKVEKKREEPESENPAEAIMSFISGGDRGGEERSHGHSAHHGLHGHHGAMMSGGEGAPRGERERSRIKGASIVSPAQPPSRPRSSPGEDELKAAAAAEAAAAVPAESNGTGTSKNGKHKESGKEKHGEGFGGGEGRAKAAKHK